MQPQKSTKLFFLSLLITCCGWWASATEAQQLSSRKAYMKRANGDQATAANGVRSQFSQSNRIDHNNFRSWKASFSAQEKDTTPDQAGSELESNSLRKTSDLDSDDTEEKIQLDADWRSLDDEADTEALGFEDGPDQPPTRPMFGAWPKKGIRGIAIDIRETNTNTPQDVSHQFLDSNASDWTQFYPQPKEFAWAAPDIRYQPLYFEDVALERYGQTAGPYHQSLISAFHFFKDFVFLPHKFRHDCPGSCDHPLGFCRPGNTTPYSFQRHYFGRPGLNFGQLGR